MFVWLVDKLRVLNWDHVGQKKSKRKGGQKRLQKTQDVKRFRKTSRREGKTQRRSPENKTRGDFVSNNILANLHKNYTLILLRSCRSTDLSATLKIADSRSSLFYSLTELNVILSLVMQLRETASRTHKGNILRSNNAQWEPNCFRNMI